jgi:hypothetical protein
MATKFFEKKKKKINIRNMYVVLLYLPFTSTLKFNSTHLPLQKKIGLTCF